jgi:hypothetical protein
MNGLVQRTTQKPSVTNWAENKLAAIRWVNADTDVLLFAVAPPEFSTLV